MSRVVQGLYEIFGPGTLVSLVGHPRMSRAVPGLLGIFGPGTLVVMSSKALSRFLDAELLQNMDLDCVAIVVNINYTVPRNLYSR